MPIGKLIAGLFSLSAFAVAIVAGLAAENNAAQIMLRAIIAMLLCYPLGYAVGAVAEHVIESHVAAHARQKAAASASAAAQAQELAAKSGQDEEVIAV